MAHEDRRHVGGGIAPLLPAFLARYPRARIEVERTQSGELAAGRTMRVLPDYRAAGGTAYMVYPPAKPLSPELVKFCAHLAEHVPRLAVQP